MPCLRHSDQLSRSHRNKVADGDAGIFPSLVIFGEKLAYRVVKADFSLIDRKAECRRRDGLRKRIHDVLRCVAVRRVTALGDHLSVFEKHYTVDAEILFFTSFYKIINRFRIDAVFTAGTAFKHFYRPLPYFSATKYKTLSPFLN